MSDSNYSFSSFVLRKTAPIWAILIFLLILTGGVCLSFWIGDHISKAAGVIVLCDVILLNTLIAVAYVIKKGSD